MVARARKLPHEHEGACALDVQILADAINIAAFDTLLGVEITETGIVLADPQSSFRFRGDITRRLYRETVAHHLAEIIAVHYRTERLEQITGKPAEVQP